MIAQINTKITDHDAAYEGPLTPTTDVEIKVSEAGVTVQLPEDLTKDDTLPEEERPQWPRTVLVEVDSKGTLKVHVYPFDTEEPVTVRVDLSGGYEVETP